MKAMKKHTSPGVWPTDGLEYIGRCPICDSTARGILYDELTDRVFYCAPGTWRLYRCRGCHAAYLDPRPDLDTIDQAYADYFTHEEAPSPSILEPMNIPAGKLRFALRNGYLNKRFGYSLKPALDLGFFFARLLPLSRAREDRGVRHLQFASQHPHLLDVGCGNGGFLRQMTELGWQAQGLDPDPKAVSAAIEAGVAVQHGTLLDSGLPDDYFDAITLGHVIEHLHDPAANLEVCYRALRPNGLIWIGTPNLSSLGHAKFRRSWIGLDPPRHLVLFTPDSLRHALESVGFRITSYPPVLRGNSFFRTSAAMERGLDPMDPPPLPRSLQSGALLADFLSWLRPGLSEELVLIARKEVCDG